MAKGRKHNSTKRNKNSKPDNDIDDGNDNAGVKKCPHLSKGVKCEHLQNKVPHITLGCCSNCDDTNSPVGVWICLKCSHQGCDRYSKEKHALSHFESNRSHSIVLHLQNWNVWCYICDDEVLIDSSPMLHNLMKLLRKAMNLPVNTSGVNTPKNQNATGTNFMSDRQEAGPSSKNPSQFRGHIKGLSNLGNTCFFNAVVQNLCQIDLLYVALSCAVKTGHPQLVCSNKKDMLSVTVQDEPGSVTAALWGLLTDVRTSNNRTLNPRQLFGEICKKATRFKGYRQQDSQELLRYLLDSIRNEELRRVKTGLLKAFDLKNEGDAKNLEDNKRKQIKEYNACARAPLIDSVFAGKLVSIVICHQCHQEFKVEETFLDLSLPLTSPQETNSNKPFAKLGKQSQQSLATPSSSTPKKQNGDEGKDLKAKTPSKHQLKVAKKAERKKKKVKGPRRKGKVSPESIEETRDDMEKEDTQAQCETECDGPGETSKYETEPYNNGKESKLFQGDCSDPNCNVEEGEPILSTDHEEAVDQKEDAQEKEMEIVISNEAHDFQCVDSNKVSYVEESQSQPLSLSEIEIQFSNEGEPGANNSMTNEATGAEINEEENQNNEVSVKGRINQSDGFGSPDGNPLESRKPLESEFDIPNNSMVNLQQCNLEGPPGALTGRFETNTVVTNAALAETRSNEAQIQNILRSPQDDQHVELEGSVPLNTIRTDEIEEKMEVMTLDSSEKSEGCTNRVKDDKNQTLLLNYTTSLDSVLDNDNAIQDQRNLSAENSVVFDDPEHSCHSIETEVALNEALSSEGSFSSMQTEASSSSVGNFGASGSVEGVLNENNQDEINNDVNIGLHEGMSGKESCPSRCNDNDVENIYHSEGSNGSDSAANSDPQTTNKNEDVTDETINEENTSSEFESDSEDGSSLGSSKILTLKPPYEPAPGECSVMSSLSQFCAAELLNGSNKFACEECSKRAQRVKGGKATEVTRTSNVPDKEKQGVDNTSSDSSSEDGCKGAKAPKPKKKQKKESNQQIVYTEASKQMLISVAPPVLTLHLKRFQQTRFTLRKITKHMDFPLLLDLAPFCSRSGQSRADSDGRVLYSLYGVVEHSGSLNSGHYTAYVKVKDPPMRSLYENITSMNDLTAFIENMWTRNPTKHPTCHHEPAADGQWFHVSDSSVSPVGESRVLRGQAYMLFYGRLPLTNS